jgi:hypothetical protein
LSARSATDLVGHGLHVEHLLLRGGADVEALEDHESRPAPGLLLELHRLAELPRTEARRRIGPDAAMPLHFGVDPRLVFEVGRGGEFVEDGVVVGPGV